MVDFVEENLLTECMTDRHLHHRQLCQTRVFYGSDGRVLGVRG